MKQNIWKIIVPIITGAIGVVIGGLVEWKKEDSLAQKQFEYSLIENALTKEEGLAQQELNFLLELGLITKIDTTALRVRIENANLPAVGYWDGFVISNLKGLLAAFYRRNNKFPKDMNEFVLAFPLSLHLKIIGKQNLRYQAMGNDSADCLLSFAGKDNRWGTADDKTYDTNDVLGR